MLPFKKGEDIPGNTATGGRDIAATLMARRGEMVPQAPQKSGQAPEDGVQSLETNRAFLAELQTCLRFMTSYFFPVFHFGTEILYPLPAPSLYF